MPIDMEETFALCSRNLVYARGVLCRFMPSEAIDVGQAYDLMISSVMFYDNIGAISIHRYHATATDIP